MDYCQACRVQVNFGSWPVAVSHWRSKRHCQNAPAPQSDDERDARALTKKEALAITQPRSVVQRETIPMELVAIAPDGKKYRIYADRGVVGKVKGL